MTTTLYLPASSASTPISPTPDSDWESTSILARAKASTSPISDAMATVSFASDSNNTNKDILFRQYTFGPLDGGQTITGSQALKFQARCQENGTGKNMFSTLGIRVIAGDGTTVRKTVLAVTRDDVEAAAISQTNRQFTATSAATDYVTNADNADYLVLEIGMGGTPGGLFDHTSNIRLGDAAGSDLSEDDSSTTDNRPWVRLVDTLTIYSGASGASSFSFSATGQGKSDAIGSGALSLSFTAAAVGLVSMSGASSFSFAATGEGAAVATGSGAAALSFAATGSGQAAASGSGTASFSFTTAGVGSKFATGSGASTATFTATATGKADATGHGASTMTFTAVGVGAPAFIGHGASSFSFAATGAGIFELTPQEGWRSGFTIEPTNTKFNIPG